MSFRNGQGQHGRRRQVVADPVGACFRTAYPFLSLFMSRNLTPAPRRRGSTMAETKSRREAPATQTRVRPKSDMPSNAEKAIDENMASSAPSAPVAEAFATQTIKSPERNGHASRTSLDFDS